MVMKLDTKTALLQALVEGKSYGLELIERVATRTNGRVRIVQGLVYPALHGLESDGFVTSSYGDPCAERGGRPRRYYELTAEGLRRAKSDQSDLATLFGFGRKEAL